GEQVEVVQAVTRERVEHVREERQLRVDTTRSGAVQIEGEPNLRFRRGAIDRNAPHDRMRYTTQESTRQLLHKCNFAVVPALVKQRGQRHPVPPPAPARRPTEGPPTRSACGRCPLPFAAFRAARADALAPGFGSARPSRPESARPCPRSPAWP